MKSLCLCRSNLQNYNKINEEIPKYNEVTVLKFSTRDIFGHHQPSCDAR